MELKLIGWTEVDLDGTEWQDYDNWDTITPYTVDNLLEFAGRSCYESFDRPNETTNTPETYLENILNQKHYSVIEHANFTIRITGVSRRLTHELVRHRHFSYSQKSQRYVNESQSKYVLPPVIRDLEDENVRTDLTHLFDGVQARANSAYRFVFDELRKQGKTLKEARGAAASLLPGGTETSIVVTGNALAWFEFFLKREPEHVDQEIREMAGEIHDILARETYVLRRR